MSEQSFQYSGFGFQGLNLGVQAAGTESGNSASTENASSNAVTGMEVESQLFQTTELDLPVSTGGILLLLGSIAVLAALTVRTALRDSRFLKTRDRVVLLIPRILVLALVLLIVLNPQRRTQLSRVEKSRVGILLDTSLSMAWPAGDPANGVPPEDGTALAAGEEAQKAVTPGESAPSLTDTSTTRADAAVKSLISSGVLSELSRIHAVSVYTFDSSLAGPWAIVSDDAVRFVDVAAGDPETAGLEKGSDPETQKGQTPFQAATVSLDQQAQDAVGTISDPAALAKWKSIIQPRGAETRMGESLYQLIGQISGRTLSGVVVISDGRSNTGLDVEPARIRAERSGTRLITVGVGSQKPQLNLWVAGMQSPTDVHQGDPFDITVMLQGRPRPASRQPCDCSSNLLTETAKIGGRSLRKRLSWVTTRSPRRFDSVRNCQCRANTTLRRGSNLLQAVRK
ncbi:MAG: hypothetical protein WKF77_08835 [Planctomycetaceae bacterium]